MSRPRAAELLLLHQIHEALEQVVAVVRAGAGFRVVLDREHRLALDADALKGAVKQRRMGFDDAIGKGIERAAKTLDNISGAWVQEMKVDVKDGKISKYRVNMKLTFVLND